MRDGVLHLDDAPLAIGRLADVSVPHLRATGPGGGLSPADVAGLVGRGDGLTPYGDDVLCGWLATHRAAGVATPDVDEAVRAHLSRTTLLSATLARLRAARRGHPRVRGLPRRPGHRRTRPSAADALAAVGHTSGRGLLEGARLALERLAVVAA